MSAFDTMPNDDLEQRLGAWMSVQGPDADLTPVYDTIVDTTRGSRQRPWFLVRRGIRRTTPRSDGWFAAQRLAGLGLLVLLLVLALATAVIVGSRLVRPVPKLLAALPPAPAIERIGVLQVGVPYTSGQFGRPLTFKLTARLPGSPETVDVCSAPPTSSRMIVLAHPKGCIEDLRFIRPWAVACGAAGEHPDAAALAAAILAIPNGIGSKNLGTLSTPGAVPEGMFAEAYPGRVVEMPASRTVDARADDPDGCLLLGEPGGADPTIEIRDDISAIFVLVDVDGELVVIRAALGGHDGPSAAEAVSRGYAAGGHDALRHLLGLVTDIQFGERPTTQDGPPPP